MKKTVIIYALISVLTGCSTDNEQADKALTEANAQLQLKVDSLSALLNAASGNGQSSSNKPGLLEEVEIEYLQQKGLTNPVEAIRDDLAKNNKLIPIEGSVGGTMQFYKARIHVLNRKWVLAYFEDGHNAGEMLLEYKVSSNGRITWKVLTSSLL